ncbi:hypothetical protein [Planctellipticum variicoloris]|uniref:hypothetical protein n=1 Tax=Planctellipticum variicoloris TaxID=3064265 RepID=UPI0030140371|nr:hypothetical protein SH412_002688 [Planctomycetaceae bacterium SH412]
MARYAETTSVPVDRSKAEIEAVLKRYGASEFLYGSKPGLAVVQFVCRDRMVRFTLPLPSEADKEFHQTERRKTRRSADAVLKAWEQACRQRWRALLLAIKAKLEAVAAGIAEFEDEFLAYVVDPTTNGTVGDLLRTQLEQRYLGHSTTLLGLPGPSWRQ